MNLLERPRGRRALFALLYFTEGAPIGFLWWALPTILRESGAPVDEIGALLSILVLPWALKFLWAPLVDLLRGPRFGERGWIVASQAVMVLALLPLLGRELAGSIGLLTVALLVHATAAATQDVAIDALAVRSTPASERGSVNGWMNAGMLAGRSLFGGGALLARERFGDDAVLTALIGCLLASMGLAALYRSSAIGAVGRRARPELARFRRRLGRALASRATWFALAFAAVGGAGFEALGALVGPFVLHQGGGTQTVGLFLAGPAVVCMVAGGLAGGHLSDRCGRRPAVAAFGFLLAVSILFVALLAAEVRLLAVPVLVAALALVYLGIGLFTASTYALFMDLTDPELGSTQFSAYMGMTNLCESWSARAVGAVALSAGYPRAFALFAGISLFALLLLPGTVRREERAAGSG